jgi:hypothetical protein
VWLCSVSSEHCSLPVGCQPGETTSGTCSTLRSIYSVRRLNVDVSPAAHKVNAVKLLQRCRDEAFGIMSINRPTDTSATCSQDSWFKPLSAAQGWTSGSHTSGSQVRRVSRKVQRRRVLHCRRPVNYAYTLLHAADMKPGARKRQHEKAVSTTSPVYVRHPV